MSATILKFEAPASSEPDPVFEAMQTADRLGRNLADVVLAAPSIAVVDLLPIGRLIESTLALNTAELSDEFLTFCALVGVESFRRRIREIREEPDGVA